MHRMLIAFAVILISSPSAPAAERAGAQALVYYAGNGNVHKSDEATVLAAYRRKHNVVAPDKKERFTPPTVITRTYPRTSPGGTLLPNGTVRFAAIVTPGGRVTKPMVVDAPHDYLGISVMGVLPAWRCKPALLNGAPVAAIMIYDLNVARPGAGQNSRHEPGLGHLPSQDR